MTAPVSSKPYVCRRHRLYVFMAVAGGGLFFGSALAARLNVASDPIVVVCAFGGLLLYLLSLHGHGTYWLKP